jgi:hypothetical protein
MFGKIAGWLKGEPLVKQDNQPQVLPPDTPWIDQLSELLREENPDGTTIEKMALLLGQTEEWRDPR